jgi:hypothetical protein
MALALAWAMSAALSWNWIGASRDASSESASVSSIFHNLEFVSLSVHYS